MKRRNISLLASALGMMVLILDSRGSFQASSQGLQLCINTLIPTLLPFFILSSLLTGSLAGRSPGYLAPLENVLRLPKGGCSLFLIGLLGGYPVGARCLRQAYDEKRLSKADAVRMLSFCSNAGPSFLFGIVGSFFHHWKYPWILWVIHVLSAAAVAILIPGQPESVENRDAKSSITIHKAMEQAIHTIGIVCGWVMFFRLILSFLDRWILWALPLPLQIILSGGIELSNGCIRLGELADFGQRFLTSSVTLALGGVCVTMQTKSIWGELPFGTYYRGKILQTGFSLIFAMDYLWLFERQESLFSAHMLVIGNLIFALCFVVSWVNKKNVVAFPGNLMYNRFKAHK